MQQQRRHNPYPTTWEIPAAIALFAVAILLYGIHIGRGVATWFSGHGWVWPSPPALVSAIPGVLAGDAHAGLVGAILPADAAIPGVVAWVVITESVLLSLITVASVWCWVRWGPGRMLGMATPSQVENVLGVSRLRKVRHIIRPDLYPKKRALR